MGGYGYGRVGAVGAALNEDARLTLCFGRVSYVFVRVAAGDLRTAARGGDKRRRDREDVAAAQAAVATSMSLCAPPKRAARARSRRARRMRRRAE